MLLAITTTHYPATDLGHLLRKNPDRVQTFETTFGKAHVFYPEKTAERCTAVLLLDVDPVGLVRNRRGPAGEGRTLEQYVNDRPYVASSFLSVAIADVFGSALAGNSKERPELVETPIPLSAKLSVLPCRGGEEFLRRLFEPLGYEVSVTGYPLDETFSEWGQSSYFTVRISATLPLHTLLTHVYVLVPVLDNDKHYWVGDDEVAKLLRHGEGWLGSHPEREIITRRYLKHRRDLIEEALARLVDDQPDADRQEEAQAQEEAQLERPISLNEQRLGTVMAALKESGGRRVLDLGCGEGQLLREALKEKQFEEIVGMDVSYRALEISQRRLHFDRMPPKQKERIKFLHGSLIYRDRRLSGYDAAAVVEVIEHLDPPRLSAFERVLFEFAQPTTVILTTPNSEYNVKWETLPAGKFRHRDHRFEWTREEFTTWAQKIAERFDYDVRFVPIGAVDEVVGPPTQMSIFTKQSRGSSAPEVIQ